MNITHRWNELTWHNIVPECHPFIKSLPGEEWRGLSVPNVSSKYYMSSKGRLFSTVKNRLLKLNQRHVHTQVYCQYSLNGLWYSVHRLMMLAFGPEQPRDKPEINHKDGNGANNALDNLEWCSHSHNIQHTYNALGRRTPRGSRHHMFGKHPSEETRLKMKIAKTRYWQKRKSAQLS